MGRSCFHVGVPKVAQKSPQEVPKRQSRVSVGMSGADRGMTCDDAHRQISRPLLHYVASSVVLVFVVVEVAGGEADKVRQCGSDRRA